MASNQLETRKAAISQTAVPRHVAIIMDGNGRWAARRKLPRISGHRAGIKTVRRVVQLAGELGISYLTLYTFSSENWSRPESEVKGLMDLLARTIKKELNDLNKNNVRIQTIGDLSLLPPKSREAIEEGIAQTAHNSGLTLILALNYGGRDEIVRAVRSIARSVQDEGLAPDAIDAALIDQRLDTSGIPDPDLLVRTSGEYRLSNFLLWQLAYTELWITDTTWPDFSADDFLCALESYVARERRFGKTSQQISDADADRDAARALNGSV